CTGGEGRAGFGFGAGGQGGHLARRCGFRLIQTAARGSQPRAAHRSSNVDCCFVCYCTSQSNGAGMGWPETELLQKLWPQACGQVSVPTNQTWENVVPAGSTVSVAKLMIQRPAVGGVKV